MVWLTLFYHPTNDGMFVGSKLDQKAGQKYPRWLWLQEIAVKACKEEERNYTD